MDFTPVLNRIGHPVSVAEAIPLALQEIEVVSSDKPFIQANTIESTLSQIRHEHIIPVFTKDNETVISHVDFIEATQGAIKDVFRGETVLEPSIRLSHPIKGRVPEARNKPATELKEQEKTLFYERMAFCIEVPSINTTLGDDNQLNLTIGGVKAYNLDNLHAKKGADQHFKVFVGFKNRVCTNLCISTDGYLGTLKVKSHGELGDSIHALLSDFNAVELANDLAFFQGYDLTEVQFAHLIGRCRMFRYIPDSLRQNIPELQFGDTQINAVCHDYFKDTSFCRNHDGSVNLWRLYNLFTGSNKSSYIDSFLDRAVNAYQLVKELQEALKNRRHCWYLN